MKNVLDIEITPADLIKIAERLEALSESCKKEKATAVTLRTVITVVEESAILIGGGLL